MTSYFQGVIFIYIHVMYTFVYDGPQWVFRIKNNLKKVWWVKKLYYLCHVINY